MRSTLMTMAFADVLAIVGLAMFHLSAQAGCGGGRIGGGYGGGHSFGTGYGSRGGSCGGGMSGMSMPGMNMGAPAPAPGYAPTAYPQAASRPASAGTQYTCPMHPLVVSATPASCPYCRMALQGR
jgi:hypothetical protein